MNLKAIVRRQKEGHKGEEKSCREAGEMRGILGCRIQSGLGLVGEDNARVIEVQSTGSKPPNTELAGTGDIIHMQGTWF